MSFKERFRNAIAAIYNTPAKLKVNCLFSESIPLQWGTRQGCPPSPLLFALAIEPLVIRIRNDPRIAGVHIADREHKISLYADDIVLYLTSFDSCLPAV